MFFFQHPVYQQQQQQRHHQLSVDDYVQLQLLLRQEQAQREQAALYKKQQQEQRRLEKALYNLKVMTELQRRREQEELAIQAYYAAKKKRQQQEEALLRHRRQQKEAYLNAILEQRQTEQYHLRALALEQQLQNQATKSVEYTNPCHAMAAAVRPNFAADAKQEEEVSDSDSEADQEHEVTEQLESLVRLIFGQQEAQNEQTEEDSEQEEEEKEEKDGEEETEQAEQTVTLDEFVDYISRKAQALDDDNVEYENDDAMEQDDQDLAASAIQHIDDHESEDEDGDSSMEQAEEVPDLVESNESLHHLVNDILANTTTEESFSEFPEEDPVKIAKFEALSRIEQELDQIRQRHEDHVLHVPLDFSFDGRSASPDTIPASTAENREFLGYEDQIVKILLKLDMIESDGDEHIRNERKALVKRAENILDKLDEYKQKEWERVSCSSHSDSEEMEEEYIAVL